jgi:hypothetical protein
MGTLDLNEASGLISTGVSVTDSTNGSSSPTTAFFTGTFSLLQQGPSLVFHLGGTVTCPESVQVEFCDPYSLSFLSKLYSDTDIFGDRVSYQFDSILDSILSPNPEFYVGLIAFIDVYPSDPLLQPSNFGVFSNLSLGVGFNGNSSYFDSGPFYFDNSTPIGQIGGPAVNVTDFNFLIQISGLRPGESLEFPNSFTFSILPSASDIPEPATLGLTATAGFLFWALRRRS